MNSNSEQTTKSEETVKSIPRTGENYSMGIGFGIAGVISVGGIFAILVKRKKSSK